MLPVFELSWHATLPTGAAPVCCPAAGPCLCWDPSVCAHPTRVYGLKAAHNTDPCDSKASKSSALQGPINLQNPDNRFWLIVVKSNGRGLPLLPDRWVD